jgi:mannose-6-phosphate isomerase-like protein (cupin superfamily)
MVGGQDRTFTSDYAPYAWGDHCRALPLVDGADLSVKEEFMPPGAVEGTHMHQHARQFFYILSGNGCMRLASGDIALGPFQGLEIPPGMVHQMRNDSPLPLRFLAVSSPHTRNDREEVEQP